VALVEHQARVVLAEACAHAFVQVTSVSLTMTVRSFSPGDLIHPIAVPVFVWFGDHDLMVPSSHGQWLVEHLATAIKVHKPTKARFSAHESTETTRGIVTASL